MRSFIICSQLFNLLLGCTASQQVTEAVIKEKDVSQLPHYYLNQEQLEISEEEFYGLADFRFNLFKEMQYDSAIVSFLYDRQKFGQLSQVQLQIKGESRTLLRKDRRF